MSILCLQAAAQEPTYMHYTLDDGLPSMQIYDISQDEKGFIWLATAAGISRFDGQFFDNYTTADGLPSNTVLFAEKKDSIPKKLRDKLKKYFKQRISCKLAENERDIWIGTWGGGAFYCKKDD